MWDEIGALQFDYLVQQGLRRDHRLLDVGCGALRGGVHFVGYLNSGNYFGVDRKAAFLEAGREELRSAGLSSREVTLRTTDSFDVDFGVAFDFVIAQSLFTHLPLNSIRLCLTRVGGVLLAPHGRFFATFFRSRGDQFAPVDRGDGIVTYFHRDPYHYAAKDILWASQGTTLAMDDIGKWNHPRGQEMLLFRKAMDDPVVEGDDGDLRAPVQPMSSE